MAPDGIDSAVFKTRIVVYALAAGVGGFGAVAYFLVHRGSFVTDSSLRTPLVGAMGALVIGILVGLPKIERALTSRAAQSVIDPADGLTAYSMLIILRSAMIEGVGLFGGVIYLLTGSQIGLVAVLGSIVLLLGKMPTRDQAEEFLHRISS